MMRFMATQLATVALFVLTLICDDAPISLPSPELFWKAACRGAQLKGAMQNSEPQASLFLLPISSQWDGDLRNELAFWNFREIERDQMCEFGDYWHLSSQFDMYGLDARPRSRGGPNVCYSIIHGDPWKKKDGISSWSMNEQTYTVSGKTYRVTGGFSTMGINPKAGIIFFIARKSPGKAARELWNVDEAPLSELPAIRAQSDIAWAFWNRLVNGKDLGNVNAFWAIEITNKDTNAIVNQAHLTYDRGGGQGIPGRTLPWPGVDFSVDSIEGQAILGSSNGLAVGYFLAQHKRQLGGNRFVYGIKVFRNYPEDILPNIIFWVKNAGQKRTSRTKSRLKEGKELANTTDRVSGREHNKTLVREHIINIGI